MSSHVASRGSRVKVEVSKGGRVTMKKFEKPLYPVRAVKVEMRQYYLGGNCIEEPLTPVVKGRKTDEKPTTRQTK